VRRGKWGERASPTRRASPANGGGERRSERSERARRRHKGASTSVLEHHVAAGSRAVPARRARCRKVALSSERSERVSAPLRVVGGGMRGPGAPFATSEAVSERALP